MKFLTIVGFLILITFSVEAKESLSDTILVMECGKLYKADNKEFSALDIEDTNYWYNDFAKEFFRQLENRHPSADVSEFKNEVLTHIPNPNHADDANPLLFAIMLAYKECKSNETFQEALERIILKYKNNKN